MSGTAYHISNVGVRFGARTVLELGDVTFERGATVGLLGPNGSGKTTLLEILAFLRRPSSGEVRFHDQPVRWSRTGLRPLRRRAVLIQQNPVLFTTSVGRNVAFPMKVRGVERSERERRAEDLLRRVGMERFLHAPAETLSGGETQRVAVAMALACSPEVLLLDEPTSSVDVENSGIIEEIIGTMTPDPDVTTIFSTHEREQAARLATRTAWLFGGSLHAVPPENVWDCHVEAGDAMGAGGVILPNGTRLWVDTVRRGPVRVSVDPSRVDVSPAVGQTVEKNSQRGRIVQVSDEGDAVRIVTDTGIRLTALMSRATFHLRQLNIGTEVFVDCPPESVTIWE